MAKYPRTVFGNYPTWLIECGECGEPFNPKTMYVTLCPTCAATNGDERRPAKQVELVEPITVDDDLPCMCEPCPIDLSTKAWRVEREDPSFEGSQCAWHWHIPGKQVIDDSRGGFVDEQGRKMKYGFDVAKPPKKVSSRMYISPAGADLNGSPMLLVDYGFSQEYVPARDLNRYAKKIGAKRK